MPKALPIWCRLQHLQTDPEVEALVGQLLTDNRLPPLRKSGSVLAEDLMAKSVSLQGALRQPESLTLLVLISESCAIFRCYMTSQAAGHSSVFVNALERLHMDDTLCLWLCRTFSFQGSHYRLSPRRFYTLPDYPKLIGFEQ